MASLLLEKEFTIMIVKMKMKHNIRKKTRHRSRRCKKDKRTKEQTEIEKYNNCREKNTLEGINSGVNEADNG